MLKILIRLLIFVFFIGLSLYVGVQWKLSQDLDYLVSKTGYGARFTYGSSSISPTGEITINDIVISIPSEEIKITIQQAKYKAGSILDMAGNTATVERDIQGGKEVVEVVTPFVLSAAKGMAEARIPNMRGIMAARTKPLNVIEPTEVADATTVVEYELPPAKGDCKMVSADNPAELLELLRNEAKII